MTPGSCFGMRLHAAPHNQYLKAVYQQNDSDLQLTLLERIKTRMFTWEVRQMFVYNCGIAP